MALKDLLPWNKKSFDDFESPNEHFQEDCLSCRVVGSTALVSLGGYSYYSGMRELKLRQKAIEMSKSKYKYGSRQLGIVSLSLALAGMGVYRMVN